MTDLEVQIKELATVVEHIIQQRLTEIVFTNDKVQKEKIHERLWDSLKQVAEEFDCVQKESAKFQDNGKQAPKEFLVQDSCSVKHTPYVENNMVGRDDQRKRMLTELTRYGGLSGELKVVPIVGMGGIGKTTLAKEVYNDAFIQFHFDVHSWATVSQQHDVKRQISVKRLVRLWMAEGFLKLENDLEEEAEKCLQELVDRCLVLVSKKSLDETKIRSFNRYLIRDENSLLNIPSAKAFPATLKKLKLIETGLSWEDLNIIGELHNLEVLKLKYDACRGDEWHPIEEGFARLKVLQLVWDRLKYWKATSDNFPILE
ncbi:hypothetical protein BC332_24422 [Capsicum chinense]|nr:hypothetical protein BC332_24422 [Capsicum chinense]